MQAASTSRAVGLDDHVGTLLGEQALGAAQHLELGALDVDLHEAGVVGELLGEAVQRAGVLRGVVDVRRVGLDESGSRRPGSPLRARSARDVLGSPRCAVGVPASAPVSRVRRHGVVAVAWLPHVEAHAPGARAGRAGGRRSRSPAVRGRRAAPSGGTASRTASPRPSPNGIRRTAPEPRTLARAARFKRDRAPTGTRLARLWPGQTASRPRVTARTRSAIWHAGAVLSRLSRGATIVAALALLAPATASAFTPTGVTAAPADTQAGANRNFTLHFGVDEPARDLKGFVIHLPPGEVGAVTATPLCTQAQFAAKACPATTQVGTTATHATAYPTPITGLAVDVPGKLYNLAPVGPGARAAGHPPDPRPSATRSCCSRSSPCARPTAAWTRAPTACRATSALGPIDINAVDITLLRQGGQIRPRASSPTRRRARWPRRRSTPRLRRHAGLGLGLVHADRLRQARLRPDAQRRHRARAPRAGGPRCTTVVESPAGPGQRAHACRSRSRPGSAPLVTTLNHACPEAVFAQGACAANAQIGSARAETPALAAPLDGPGGPGQARRFAAARAHHRPARADRPAAAGDRRLRGRRAPAVDARRPARHRAEPLHADPRRRARRAARPTRATCAAAPVAHVDAAFAGQNGATSSSSVIPQIAGCKPQVRATLKGLRRAIRCSRCASPRRWASG